MDIIPEIFELCYFYATKTVNFFAEEPRVRLVSSAKIGAKLGKLQINLKKEIFMTMLIAAVIVAVMVWALIKKYETRMVLIAGGLALACLAADPLEPLKSSRL